MAFERTNRRPGRTTGGKRKTVSNAAIRTLEALEPRVLLSVSHVPDFSGDVSDLSFNPNATTPAGLPKITPSTDTPANAVQLVDGQEDFEATSVWETTPQGVDTFDTTFDFGFGTALAPGADGFSFTLQNGGGANAVGGVGGGLGFFGITNAVSIKFDIYPSVSTTGLFLNGELATDNPVQAPGATPIGSGISVDLTAGGVDFHANPTDRFRCHLVYDGTTLTETVSDVTKNTSVTQAYNVLIPGAVGDHSAYVGFTGATGGVHSEQYILNWTYTGTEGTGQLVLPTPTLSGSDGQPGSGQATLTWNDPTNNEQGYELDDSTDNGATYSVWDSTFPNPSMPYTLNGLDLNTTYLFKVKTLGDGSNFLDSPFSNTVLIHGGGVVTSPIVHSPNFTDVNDLTLNGGATGARFTGAGVQGTVATPTAAPGVDQAAGGSLTPGTTYYVTYTWPSAAANHGETAASPEATITLSGSNGTATVTPPTAPANAGNANVFIGTASGGETFAGNVAGGQTLSIPALPGGGRAVPTVNTTFDTPANALQLTQSANFQDGSAFTTGLQLVNQFDTTFDFTMRSDSPATADGMTFLIQHNQPTALGSTGGGLGYSSILHSVAIKFDLYDGRSNPAPPTTQTSTVGVYTNSQLNDDLATGPGQLNAGYDVGSSGINFHNTTGDVFRAHVIYDGTTLHLTLTDLNNPTATFTQEFPIDILGTIGSPVAYVGFTGATGGLHAEQDILQWTMPTATVASQTVVGTSGNDTITLKKNSDGMHDDVWVNMPTSGPATTQVLIGQPIFIVGNGGTDNLVFDSSNGSPLGPRLVLNSGTGSFTVSGLSGIGVGQVIDIGKSTVNIPYTGTSILPAFQSALNSGGIISSDAAGTSGKFAIADVDDGSQVSLSYRVVGDLNGDGTVGFSDLLTLAQNYNGTGKDWSKGDLNYDGTVGFADLLALAQHYNQTAGATAAAATDSTDILAATLKRSRRSSSAISQ